MRCNVSFDLVSCQGFESSVLVKLSSTVVRAHLRDLSIQDCSVGAIYPKVNSNAHFSPFAGCLWVFQQENDLNRSGSCSEMLQAANCIRNVRNFEAVPLLEFMYVVFTCMPGESYCRWFGSFLLCLCDVFWVRLTPLWVDPVLEIAHERIWWEGVRALATVLWKIIWERT